MLMEDVTGRIVARNKIKVKVGIRTAIACIELEATIEGWKENKQDHTMSWIDVLNHHLWTEKITEEEYDEVYRSQVDTDQAPQYVLPTPRLFDDLDVLEAMFSGESPTRFPIRHSKTAEVYYGFCDSSGR